jgi:hypothetical protein
MAYRIASKQTMKPKTIERRGTSNLARVLLALAFSAAASAPLYAQTHKVAAPETVVRAIGVYEWTGDMAKPNASRLIPVSLFIDGKLEDAGVYLARPVPLALLTGNLYEVDQAGIAKGTVDLLYSRHFEATETATTTYDDGWFGYGKFAPPAPPKKSTLRASKTLPVINAMDDDKPHFSSKSATPGSGAASTPAPGTSTTTDAPPDDPDRPTLHRSANSTPDSGTSDQTASTGSTTGSSSTGDTPPADPNRPTLHRTDTSNQTASTGSSTSGSGTSGSSSSGSGTSGSSTTGSGNTSDTPVDDPDRPTLRRRTPEQAKQQAKSANQSNVTDVGSLNDDPNRPILHHGKGADLPTEKEFPKLSGLPGDQDLHQMVAVSDAANRPPHDFTRAWTDEAEHQDVLAKMQAAARAQLTAYAAANTTPPANGAAAATPAKPALSATHTANSKLRKAPAPTPPPPPEPLLDEDLKAYTLSYGGAATYVYTAHTAGLGPTLRFVTLVAQVNMQSEPEVAFKSVTDAAHLDRTPRYRLVDVVDAEASNRASLLFELREQNSRQFALYRVIGARADQTFLTGTTQ